MLGFIEAIDPTRAISECAARISWPARVEGAQICSSGGSEWAGRHVATELTVRVAGWGRGATVEAVKPLACLCLARERFVELLGPLEALMNREKSDQASQRPPLAADDAAEISLLQAFMSEPPPVPIPGFRSPALRCERHYTLHQSRCKRQPASSAPALVEGGSRLNRPINRSKPLVCCPSGLGLNLNSCPQAEDRRARTD